MADNTTARRSTAFTLVELLVVIGIIALLISILLPSLNRARESAKTAQCLSNLRQIGIALLSYSNDHNQFIVPGKSRKADYSASETWASILVAGKYLPYPITTNGPWAFDGPATGMGTVFHCPNGVDWNWRATPAFQYPAKQTDGAGARFLRGSYGNQVDTWYGVNGVWWFDVSTDDPWNYFDRYPFVSIITDSTNAAQRPKLHKLNQIRRSSEFAMVFDGLAMAAEGYTLINARHGGAKLTNVLHADGHAESLPVTSMPQSDDAFRNADAGGLKPAWRMDLR